MPLVGWRKLQPGAAEPDVIDTGGPILMLGRAKSAGPRAHREGPRLVDRAGLEEQSVQGVALALGEAPHGLCQHAVEDPVPVATTLLPLAVSRWRTARPGAGARSISTLAIIRFASSPIDWSVWKERMDQSKLAAIAAAQEAGTIPSGADPFDVMAMVIAMSMAWSPVSNVYAASEADSTTDHRRRRLLVRTSVQRAFVSEPKV